MALNDILDKIDLTDTFKTFHTKAAEYAIHSFEAQKEHYPG